MSKVSSTLAVSWVYDCHHACMPSLNNPGGTMPVPIFNVENGGLEKGNMCEVTKLPRGEDGF